MPERVQGFEPITLPRRMREVVLDYFVGANEYGATAASLQKYFDAYAVAARRT